MENFGYRYRRSSHQLPRRKITLDIDKPKKDQTQLQEVQKEDVGHSSPQAYKTKSSRKTWIRMTSILLVLTLFVLLGGYKLSTKTNIEKQPSSTPSASTTIDSNGNIVQSNQNQPTAAGSNGQTKSSTSNTRSAPNFTVYFPVGLSPELQVDKSTIAYSANSFNFAIKQPGQTAIVVNEQPAGDNLKYQQLKIKLGSPHEVDTDLGKAVVGVLSGSYITVLKTEKNTLIIINCTALVCAAPSGQIVNSLKINNDPTHISTK